MHLRESPFPNGFSRGLHAVGWGLIFPCFWFLDRLIAVCVSTTLEQSRRREEECYLHPLKVFFGIIVFFILFIVSTPFALLGFLLWAPLQTVRRPFSYYTQTQLIPLENRNASWEETGKISFGFVSGNLCLLPDGIARFNNLGNTQERAQIIGKSIVQGVTRPHIRILVDSPSSAGAITPSSSLIPQPNPNSSYGSVDNSKSEPMEFNANDSQEPPKLLNSLPNSTQILPNCNQNSNHEKQAPQLPTRDSDVPLEVSSLFPSSVDIVCLQEVFDKRAALKLRHALAPLYGHVLYDVGVYGSHPCGSCSSFKFFNSGLFLASRFPVLDAQYHCFPNSRGEDALAAKGLLTVKVGIGLQKGEKKMIGYINCTHLHAPEGEGEIRFQQLDMVMQWISEFQTQNKQDDESVVFDVLCGDFNFDNCSPDDRLEQNHPVFGEYTDPCRAGAGKEKPWVIGTLLEQPTLYDENMRTPENLQRTLESEDLRKLFVSPPVPLEGVPLVYPEAGQPWVGRRIDYLLYRQHHDTHNTTEVEEFTLVTALAAVSDHVPVGFRLAVSLNSQTNS